MNLQSKKPDLPASEVSALLLRLVESAKNLAAATQVNLPIEKRMELIALLWELSLCDDALHPREAERIEKIAKMIGVSSLRAMAEKMNAATKAGARRPS